MSWQRGISIAVAAFSLCFLAYKAYGSLDELAAYDWQIRYLYLLPSLVLFLFQLVVIVWGWQSIMNSLAHPLPFREHLKIYSYTNLARRIPAGMLWMVAGRAYAYKNQEISARVSAIGSFLELLIVVLTGLPLAMLAAIWLGLISPEIGIVLAIATAILELGVVHPAVLGRLFSMARQPLEPRLTYCDLLLWAFIYTIVWLVSGAGLFVIACLFTDMPMETLPVTIGVWVLSSLIAYFTLLSPSGLGVKELSLVFLLGTFLPDPLPLLTALAIRVIWTIYEIVVACVLVLAL